MRGQLSAEMLIVLVLVLGLAIFLASTMYKSASKAGAAIDKKTDEVTSGNSYSPAIPSGGACSVNSQCLSGVCDVYTNTCT
jgi:uncharacterized membrane protein